MRGKHRPQVNRDEPRFYPLIVAVITALLALGFLAEAARGDAPEAVTGIFCGYGESSGGHLKSLYYCGGGGTLPSPRLSRLLGGSSELTWVFAIGEGEAEDEDAPDVDFTSARVGARRLFDGSWLYIGADFWRTTGIVSVPSLGGLDVVEVDYGPALSAGADIPIKRSEYDLSVATRYAWGQEIPRANTADLSVSWGPAEVGYSWSDVQGVKVEGWHLTARYELGQGTRADREDRQLKSDRLGRAAARE